MSRVYSQADYNEYKSMVDQLKAEEMLMHPSYTTDIIHAAIGISTEAGELLDPIKKLLFYGKPLDHVNLDEEVGDLLWYIVLYCNARGITIFDLMETNYAKLRTRYGEKFTQDKALNRDLDAERSVLEGDAGHLNAVDNRDE